MTNQNTKRVPKLTPKALESQTKGIGKTTKGKMSGKKGATTVPAYFNQRKERRQMQHSEEDFDVRYLRFTNNNQLFN